jgi:hypothetical protein
MQTHLRAGADPAQTTAPAAFDPALWNPLTGDHPARSTSTSQERIPHDI